MTELRKIKRALISVSDGTSLVEFASALAGFGVENIDIGGPAMIRSAAKNWRDIAVVTDVDQYSEVIAELAANGGSLSLETRQTLATVAYSRTAAYDKAISTYLIGQTGRNASVNERAPTQFQAHRRVDLSK